MVKLPRGDHNWLSQHFKFAIIKRHWKQILTHILYNVTSFACQLTNYPLWTIHKSLLEGELVDCRGVPIFHQSLEERQISLYFIIFWTLLLNTNFCWLYLCYFYVSLTFVSEWFLCLLRPILFYLFWTYIWKVQWDDPSTYMSVIMW